VRRAQVQTVSTRPMAFAQNSNLTRIIFHYSIAPTLFQKTPPTRCQSVQLNKLGVYAGVIDKYKINTTVTSYWYSGMVILQELNNMRTMPVSMPSSLLHRFIGLNGTCPDGHILL